MYIFEYITSLNGWLLAARPSLSTHLTNIHTKYKYVPIVTYSQYIDAAHGAYVIAIKYMIGMLN